MKLSLIAATSLAVVVTAQKGPYGEIDTNRAPRLFDPPTSRRGGYTYADEWSVTMNAEMDAQGMAFKGTFDGMADTTMTVTSLPQDQTKIDISLQNVKGSIESFIMTIHCDSNDRAHSDPDCEELFAVVGAEESIVVDAQGNILQVVTPDGETVDFTEMVEEQQQMEMAGMPNGDNSNMPMGQQQQQQNTLTQPQTLAGKFQANQFAAAHHFDKSQQLLKRIPDHAVRPGDSWIDDVDMQGMGTFKGNSVLQGYTTYEGADCAVFYFEGTLHLDVTEIAKAMGIPADDPANSMLPSNMADAIITNIIFWDYTDDISRWTQVNISTAFDVPNPMNPNDPTPVHIPVDVVLSLNTDITGRPEGEDAKTNEASTPSYNAAGTEKEGMPLEATTAESESSSEKKSGRGWGIGIFFALLVGMGAAGFVIYKKREEGNQFFQRSRPTYEFSPVGNDGYVFQSPMV